MKKLYIIILLIFACMPSFGQRLIDPNSQEEPLVEKSITLDDALANAYTTNPSISAAQNKIQTAIHHKKAIWGLGAPKIGVGANYTYMSQSIGEIDLNTQKNNFVGFLEKLPLPLPPSIIGSIKGLDLSYTLQQRDFALVNATMIVPIWTGGKLNAANRAAKIGISQAENNMSQVRSKLFTEIAEVYWGLQLAYKLEELQNNLVQSMKMHKYNAEQLETNGIIAHGEKLFADMALSQAKAAAVTTTNKTKTVNVALGGLIGNGGKYNPTTPLFINRNIESLDYFKNNALKNNHTLEMVELMKRLSQEAVKVELSNFFPTVGAMGTASLWNYNLTDQLPRWMVGATVSWNLFNGLTREQNYAAAKSQVREVEALQSKATTDIQTLVEKVYNQLISAIEQVDASNATIVFAEEYVKIQTKAFAEGMATSVNLVDAHLNLNKAKVERMAAAYSYDVSLAQLLALAGITNQFSQYQIGNGYEVIK